MKRNVNIGMVCGLIMFSMGCQNQDNVVHKHIFKDPAVPPVSKKWDKTLLPPPRPSVKEDKIATINKNNYIKGLPDALPKVSTFYTFTINLSKGDASRWKSYGFHLAVFDRSTSAEEPNRIIDGEKAGNLLVFQSVPSASYEHLDLFGIGSAPDYGRNNYIAIYANNSLVKQNKINFVMGHAMGVSHFITDMNGRMMEKGKDFDEIAGSWFTLKSGEWLKLMEKDPTGNTHLVFEFKIESN